MDLVFEGTFGRDFGGFGLVVIITLCSMLNDMPEDKAEDKE